MAQNNPPRKLDLRAHLITPPLTGMQKNNDLSAIPPTGFDQLENTRFSEQWDLVPRGGMTGINSDAPLTSAIDGIFEASDVGARTEDPDHDTIHPPPPAGPLPPLPPGSRIFFNRTFNTGFGPTIQCYDSNAADTINVPKPLPISAVNLSYAKLIRDDGTILAIGERGEILTLVDARDSGSSVATDRMVVLNTDFPDFTGSSTVAAFPPYATLLPKCTIISADQTKLYQVWITVGTPGSPEIWLVIRSATTGAIISTTMISADITSYHGTLPLPYTNACANNYDLEYFFAVETSDSIYMGPAGPPAADAALHYTGMVFYRYEKGSGTITPVKFYNAASPPDADLGREMDMGCAYKLTVGGVDRVYVFGHTDTDFGLATETGRPAIWYIVGNTVTLASTALPADDITHTPDGGGGWNNDRWVTVGHVGYQYHIGCAIDGNLYVVYYKKVATAVNNVLITSMLVKIDSAGTITHAFNPDLLGGSFGSLDDSVTDIPVRILAPWPTINGSYLYCCSFETINKQLLAQQDTGEASRALPFAVVAATLTGNFGNPEGKYLPAATVFTIPTP